MDANQPEGFREVQRRFAAHIRDPEHHPAPEGVADRRMGVYRDLFFNNLKSILSSCFPVLSRIYGPEGWNRMVRAFFAGHRAHTPFFLEIPREFLTWLTEARAPEPGDPPFLTELAHYEWVELALSVDQRDIDWADIDAAGDLLAHAPALSPLAWPLKYAYPVHRIGPACQPAEPPPEPTWLVVYRDREDTVGFIQINAITARLLTIIREKPEVPGHTALAELAGELPGFAEGVVIQGGHQALIRLRAHDVVLGTRAVAGPDA